MQNNNWNSNIEKIVKQIQSSARQNRLLHIEYANRSRSTYNILTIAGMVIGPTTGMLAGSKEIICDADDRITNGAIIGLSLISSLIVSIIKFGNFDEMHHLHKEAASAYHMIENNTELQLLMEKKDRVKAEEYIKWLQAKYEDIFEKSPLLPSYMDTSFKDIGFEVSVIPEESETVDSSDGIKIDTNVFRYELERLDRL